jgi:uncharacterized caspase-like protein
LVTDTSEADLRREVRKFASDSAKADIAFIFYAGHARNAPPAGLDHPTTLEMVAIISPHRTKLST